MKCARKKESMKKPTKRVMDKYRIKKRGAYGVWGKVFYVDEILRPATPDRGAYIKPLKWFWTEKEAQAYINELQEAS